MSRARVLDALEGKTLEGWDLDYFLAKGLRRKKCVDLREVMLDLETWLEAQG
jgi:hypothetical protein